MTSRVHESERHQESVDPDYCVNCGSRPARRVTFHQVIGMVIASRRETFSAVVCKSCGQATITFVLVVAAVIAMAVF